MARSKAIRTVLLTACVLAVSVGLGGGANAALVKVGTLVLRADGSFKPTHLPAKRYKPINLFGRADINLTTGGPPPALVEVDLDFDRDGRISTAGLAKCDPAKLAGATTRQARSRCKDAIVGDGVVGAFVERDGIKVEVNRPATLFNGPRVNGQISVVGHVYAPFPSPRAYVAVIPIEKRRGAYRYRAHIDVPQIAENGVISHVDGRIGRSYVYRGKPRSYVSARCGEGVLRVHGHFLFADENATIIDGAIEKPCYPEGK